MTIRNLHAVCCIGNPKYRGELHGRKSLLASYPGFYCMQYKLLGGLHGYEDKLLALEWNNCCTLIIFYATSSSVQRE